MMATMIDRPQRQRHEQKMEQRRRCELQTRQLDNTDVHDYPNLFAPPSAALKRMPPG